MAIDMTERYTLHYLAVVDMARALVSLDHRTRIKNRDVRAALLRDAVVSYAKPFSGNRGITTKRGLRIDEQGVPEHLRAKHEEILGYRNQLFAHMDLDRQKPKLDKHFGLEVAGYETVHAEHLVAPLKKLAKALHLHLLREVMAMRAGHV